MTIDRHLEGDAEGEEHREDEGEVLLDVGHPGHAFRRELRHEAEHHREKGEIGKGHADEKQDHRGGHQRHRQLLLMGIQTRRDKGPDLIQHVRQDDQKGRHQGDLHGYQKDTDNIRGDHLAARGSFFSKGSASSEYSSRA
jgi:hypothetical protein